MEFAELKLKGLPAASLVDKAEAWLYDTKKRKLIHLVADSHTQAFTVKSQTASLVLAPLRPCKKLCANQQMLSKQYKRQASQPHVRSTRI
jgi:hypothetical protein